MRWVVITFLASCLGGASCASTTVASGGREHLEAGTAEGSPSDAELHPVCVLSQSSNLPHVHIEFISTQCVFSLAEARAGISIAYDVIIDEDVSGFRPVGPYPYDPDVAMLDLTETLDGGDQHYCDCDQGYPSYGCPLQDGGLDHTNLGCGPVTLKKGGYHRVFTWEGVNWNGYSDTSQPKGAPFPAGTYALRVSTAAGTVSDGDGGAADAGVAIRRSVTAEFLVRLVP